MKLKFKNRIAFFNTIAAAISTLIVFVAVYFVVFFTAYRHLDGDIRKEQEDITHDIVIDGDHISRQNVPEWDEKEHNQVEVNPTFLQITGKNGELIFLSPNMKKKYLPFDHSITKEVFFDNQFNNERIRQGQFPVRNNAGQIVGQISIGVSQTESALILNNLGLTLLIAFPLLTFIFYWASALAASRGIAPIHRLIQTASGIDEQNIGVRLPLPPRHDEIYQLGATINDLLGRIENSLKREKQIAADISHELRSPLAGIRGTIEVLLRKRRDPEQYEQKLEQVLRETDRMNGMFEQLLQLARIEAGTVQPHQEQLELLRFFNLFLEKWEPLLLEKNTTVNLQIPAAAFVTTDANLLEIIAGNLLSNALKYGATGGRIDISWAENVSMLSFRDNGPGIPAAHLPYIFDRFYRSDESRNIKIPGTGLGLSIVKKLAGLMDISVQVQSEEGRGTTFLLIFL